MIVGIGDSEEPVEPMTHRQELGLMSQVPFADASRRVPALFQQPGDRHFVRVEADLRVRKQHRRDADPVGIAPGHHRRTRRRAVRRGGIEGRELPPARGQPVEVWRLDVLRSETTDVIPTDVVSHNVNDVRRSVSGGNVSADRGGQDC